MKFITESGTIYEIQGDKVRRVLGSDSHDMRRDGEWIALHYYDIGVGFPATLSLEPLGDGDVTIRTTSRVVELWV